MNSLVVTTDKAGRGSREPLYFSSRSTRTDREWNIYIIIVVELHSAVKSNHCRHAPYVIDAAAGDNDDEVDACMRQRVCRTEQDRRTQFNIQPASRGACRAFESWPRAVFAAIIGGLVVERMFPWQQHLVLDV